MTRKNRTAKSIRGWLPKEPFAAYANKPLKPRWKKPAWIALTLVAVIALSFLAYRGIQIYINYINPQADVTASYFDKSLNCTTANVGDIVEVKTNCRSENSRVLARSCISRVPTASEHHRLFSPKQLRAR